MNMFRTAMCLSLVCVVCVSGIADEKKGKGKSGVRKAPGVTQRFVAKMELTAEQIEKIGEIDKRFAVRAKELSNQRGAILTDKQKQDQKDAAKAAKAAGKTPAEARKAVQAALHLTDEQSARMKEHGKAQMRFSQEVIGELRKVLTAEQQEKLPKQRSGSGVGEKKGKGKGKKKKDAA